MRLLMQDSSPLGYEFAVQEVVPARISIMPIMRSGLGMIEGTYGLGDIPSSQSRLIRSAIETRLPNPGPIHHLGLFRDKTTMTAVEYYNNLPYSKPNSPDSTTEKPSELAILIDPVIATGATACAAIDTLREWGVSRILMICVIASKPGLVRAAQQWPEGVEIWAGGVDDETDSSGMIKPGLGDIGDRLFLTIGK